MPWNLPWSMADERGLTRYVMPDATQLLALPKSRSDILATPVSSARVELVRLIYEALIDQNIRYVGQAYRAEQEQQPIRTPDEILKAPREGTALDLAVLFCGLCLGYDLVPVLILTKGHAFAAVSQMHGRRDASNKRVRSEIDDFPRGLLVDADILRELIDDGRYVAVECTGFAHSETMSLAMPEGQGRFGGILSFARAREAGSEQLEVRERPLLYALDIATLQDKWGFAPFGSNKGGDQARVNITNNAPNQGAQGNFYGPVTIGTTISGDVVGGDKVMGDKIMGDKVGGDKILVGTRTTSGGEAALESFSALKRRALEQRFSSLIEEYEAVGNQLNLTLSSVDRLRLQRTLDGLEQQMQQVEAELMRL